MHVFETYRNLPEHARNGVVAIGNFDGVHLGHQALLKKAKTIAQEQGAPLTVLTFEPHPRALFRPDEPPHRITPPALKQARLKDCGTDTLLSLPFDWDFASQTADAFIQNILTEGLNARHIVIGYDFRFGQLRAGDAQTLRDAGFDVTVVEQVSGANGEGISSSHIRALLRHGKIQDANAALGWPWELHGTVFRGDRRGHALGYPTANIALEDMVVHPAYGVYACQARVEDEDIWYGGACNIGIRPMFEVKTAQVETFIFDFNREIYDQILHIRPVERLRSEAKFDSLDALIVQMEHDCMLAREILERY